MYLKLAMATSLLISSSCEPLTYETIKRTNEAPYKIKELELPNKYNNYPAYVSNEEKIGKMMSELERMKKEKEEAERKAREEEYRKLAERQAELERIKAEEERKAKEEAERLRKLEEDKQKQQQQTRSQTIVEGNTKSSTVSNARTLTVNASAYTYAEQDPNVSSKWGNKTFTGKDVRFGYVAVDPNVIPLGTRMKIEGYGDTIFTAEDTGNAIKGYKLDIFLPSYDECIQFGRRNIKIYILD